DVVNRAPKFAGLPVVEKSRLDWQAELFSQPKRRLRPHRRRFGRGLPFSAFGQSKGIPLQYHFVHVVGEKPFDDQMGERQILQWGYLESRSHPFAKSFDFHRSPTPLDRNASAYSNWRNWTSGFMYATAVDILLTTWNITFVRARSIASTITSLAI